MARAIGQEIRRARAAIGWTRADLVERLDVEVHVQTIAGYEHGTRHCTVARLVEICRALDVPAPDLLAFALQRAEIDLGRTEVHVDLNAILRDDRPELAALRGWARHRLDTGSADTAKLEPAAVETMAHFCQMSRASMLTLLAGYTPELV